MLKENEETTLDKPTVGDMLLTNMPLNVKGMDGRHKVLPMGFLGRVLQLKDYPNVTMIFPDPQDPNHPYKRIKLDLPVTVLVPHFH